MHQRQRHQLDNNEADDEENYDTGDASWTTQETRMRLGENELT